MNTPVLLALAFLLYQPIFVFFLFLCTQKYQGFEIGKVPISLLGTAVSPRKTLFNVVTTLYGVLSFGLPMLVFQTQEFSSLIFLGILALTLCGIGTALVGIFPTDSFHKPHIIASYITFGGVALTGVIFIPIIYMALPFKTVTLSLCCAAILAVLVMHKLFLSKKSNHAFAEWVSATVAIVWNSLMSFLLLAR